jgi:hypothetical protein
MFTSHLGQKCQKNEASHAAEYFGSARTRKASRDREQKAGSTDREHRQGAEDREQKTGSKRQGAEDREHRQGAETGLYCWGIGPTSLSFA